MTTHTSRQPAIVWRMYTDGTHHEPIGIYDDAVPYQVRRAVLAGVQRGEHNGIVRLTDEIAYEWQS